MHAQAERVAVALAADLGLRPLRRVGLLARADLADVGMLVDPLR
jgi:hypothetical protein